MKHRIISFVAAVTLVAAASVHAGTVVNGIAAVVNDEVITLRDVEREAALLSRERARQTGGTTDDALLRKQALERLIEKSLVAQKIRELNITVSEEEIRLAIEDVKKQNNLSQEQLSKALAAQGLSFEQYRNQIREQLQRLKLMSQEVKSKITVLDSEIADYYREHQQEFSEEEKFHARHIFFRLSPSPTDDELKRVREKAEPVLALARGGGDFVSLARKYSEDPGAPQDGGDLGTFRKDDMVPEIAEVVARMTEGGVSDLVRSSAGLHILKLEQRIPPRVRPLEDVRKAIEDIIYRKKSEERFSQWATNLRKGASIEIPGS